jgi:hypothetical protein
MRGARETGMIDTTCSMKDTTFSTGGWAGRWMLVKIQIGIARGPGPAVNYVTW